MLSPQETEQCRKAFLKYDRDGKRRELEHTAACGSIEAQWSRLHSTGLLWGPFACTSLFLWRSQRRDRHY
jgi:hypothetical protein